MSRRPDASALERILTSDNPRSFSVEIEGDYEKVVLGLDDQENSFTSNERASIEVRFNEPKDTKKIEVSVYPFVGPGPVETKTVTIE